MFRGGSSGLVNFALILLPFLADLFLHISALEELEQHEKSTDKGHLLGHLGDWLDLDGQALRHIEDHLLSVADSRDDIKDIAAGDNSKGLFYFFKIHDFDNNDKMDGLEWFKALTDFHEYSLRHGGEDYDESEVEVMIDDLLRKHDIDHDGYISFNELLNDKPNSLFNELDRMADGEAEESLKEHGGNKVKSEEKEHENDSEEREVDSEESKIVVVDSQGQEEEEIQQDSQEDGGEEVPGGEKDRDNDAEEQQGRQQDSEDTTEEQDEQRDEGGENQGRQEDIQTDSDREEDQDR